MIDLKNKKNFATFIFFIIIGFSIIISTFMKHGIEPEGRLGFVGGTIAILYAFLRSKLVVTKKK